MEIDKEFVKQWIAALRSGDYTQTCGRLTDGASYCCLGVACELKSVERIYSCRSYFYFSTEMFNNVLLPRHILNEIGIAFEFQMNLSRMNDRGESFNVISYFIEEQLLGTKDGEPIGD